MCRLNLGLSSGSLSPRGSLCPQPQLLQARRHLPPHAALSLSQWISPHWKLLVSMATWKDLQLWLFEV